MTAFRRPKPPRNLRLPALPDSHLRAYCVGCSSAEIGAEAPPPDVTAPTTPNVPFFEGNGAATLPDRTAFETFAARDDVPGALGVREVKFLITDVDTDLPQIHFMHSVNIPLHYHFARDHLGLDLTSAEFNRRTYFTSQRQFIAGSIVAYDNYLRPDGTPGLYALEFWPTDAMDVRFVAQAYHMVQGAMPFAADTLAYHPTGDLQEDRFVWEADRYAAEAVRTASTQEIFESVRYNPLNLGEAVGTLRPITGSERRPPAATDVVIYETLPNDLPLVAGVISATPQTALSHVNLRARQNGIANAYLRDGADAPELAPYLGQIVRLSVTAEGIEVRPATSAERDTALAARRPAQAQFPPRNLSAHSIVPLDDLSWHSFDAFGAKATNLAELRRSIDAKFVPDGFAVPFSFYDDFMTANGLYGLIRAEIAKPAFADDAQRSKMLKAIRRAIKDAPMPDTLATQLDAMHRAFPAGTNPRCRSSANNEDMQGFTGAGLYDSYTHRPDEGHIAKSIKQVWASLWTFRAYEEREFYRIDHMTAAMGVLVHPNFDEERVNGVALTRNIYFPQFEGYFVNAQVGEDLVTNPDGDDVAEEVLVIKDLNTNNARSYETIYIRRSSLVDGGATVLNRAELMLLVLQMKTIHDHFQRLYDRRNDTTFAMDIEFKIDRDGMLAIKQARPWAG